MTRKGYTFDAKKLVKNIQTDINKEAKRQKLSIPVPADVSYNTANAFDHTLFPMRLEKKEDVISTRKEFDLFISHADSDKIDYVIDLNEALSRLDIKIFI